MEVLHSVLNSSTPYQCFCPLARKFVKCIPEILSNTTSDQGGKRDWNWLSYYLKLYKERHTGFRAITAPSYKTIQTAKQTLTTSKNLIQFTHSYFPCHLKVNRHKRVLINRLWKCQEGEKLTITANSFTGATMHEWRRTCFPPVLFFNEISTFYVHVLSLWRNAINAKRD